VDNLITNRGVAILEASRRTPNIQCVLANVENFLKTWGCVNNCIKQEWKIT
jgi:hypothetical protein